MSKNFWIFIVLALVIGAILGYSFRNQPYKRQNSNINPSATLKAAGLRPSEEWFLHLEAKNIFLEKPTSAAHLYCKEVVQDLKECQIFESDNKDARLVGTGVFAGSKFYEALPKEEKALWLAKSAAFSKMDIKFPDLPEDQKVQISKSLDETYLKVYLLWDPTKSDKPLGSPTTVILK